jgi:regulator of replication initiation timing
MKIRFPQLDVFEEKLDTLQATVLQLKASIDQLIAKESSDMSQVTDQLKAAVATLKQSEADEVARYKAIIAALQANSNDPAVQTEIDNIKAIVADLDAQAAGSPATPAPTPVP